MIANLTCGYFSQKSYKELAVTDRSPCRMCRGHAVVVTHINRNDPVFCSQVSLVARQHNQHGACILLSQLLHPGQGTVECVLSNTHTYTLDHAMHETYSDIHTYTNTPTPMCTHTHTHTHTLACTHTYIGSCNACTCNNIQVKANQFCTPPSSFPPYPT